jgi:phosphoglycerate dehydrogenase-like enzyme
MKEIIDEGALCAHLVNHPRFSVCLDPWCVEPVRQGRFAIGYPFLQLPNVVGSPHNSASVPGWHDASVRHAAGSCRRALTGQAPLHPVGGDERLRWRGPAFSAPRATTAPGSRPWPPSTREPPGAGATRVRP